MILDCRVADCRIQERGKKGNFRVTFHTIYYSSRVTVFARPVTVAAPPAKYKSDCQGRTIIMIIATVTVRLR